MATITIGSNDYDALDTLANVEAYLAGSATDQATAFSAAVELAQQKAIIEATRVLQRQSWTATDGVATAVADAADSDLPQGIKDATAELAAYIANGELDFITNASTESTQKRIKAGSVELENFRSIGVGSSGYRFPLNVFELVRPYLSSTTAASNLASSSGTSRTSQFDTGYGIIDGL
jgi:hypothetical protein